MKQFRPDPPPNDPWNSLCSSCAAGAMLSKGEGPRGMVKGCVSYAGITYAFDRMFRGEEEVEEGDISKKRK